MENHNSPIGRVPWGMLDGQQIYRYTLRNARGTEAVLTNYGAHWLSLIHRNARGQQDDLLLGYDDLEGLRNDVLYMGSVVGRHANRIANGRCQIGGKDYTFAVNNGPNHLHGGLEGFNRKVWKATECGSALTFTYESPDGEEGYPGHLTVEVTYQLSDNDELSISYRAIADQDTLVNLTNHAYFNLKGHGTATDHWVQMDAHYFTPTNQVSIPTGELEAVAGGVMDFRTPKVIAQDLQKDDTQLIYGKGYDHNFVLRKPEHGALTWAAAAGCAESGRRMDMYTTEPGVQFYTGNWIGGTTGKGGAVYNDRDGFCFEAQHFPDSPNHPQFPTTLLHKGQVYSQTTVYKFSVE